MVRPTRAVTRSRSCSAALREKVSASTWSGRAPRRSIRSAMASTRVVVLPVPGPASTSSGPPGWSTTRCCSASRVGTAGAAACGTRRYVVAGMRPFDHPRPTVVGRPGPRRTASDRVVPRRPASSGVRLVANVGSGEPGRNPMSAPNDSSRHPVPSPRPGRRRPRRRARGPAHAADALQGLGRRPPDRPHGGLTAQPAGDVAGRPARLVEGTRPGHRRVDSRLPGRGRRPDPLLAREGRGRRRGAGRLADRRDRRPHLGPRAARPDSRPGSTPRWPSAAWLSCPGHSPRRTAARCSGRRSKPPPTPRRTTGWLRSPAVRRASGIRVVHDETCCFRAPESATVRHGLPSASLSRGRRSRRPGRRRRGPGGRRRPTRRPPGRR